MDTDRFWEIVDSVKAAKPNQDRRPEELKQRLLKLEPSEIQSFYEEYIRQIDRAYSWELWGAAYIINGGCSDDCFDYFRDWLISEGKEVFESALKNPDSLASLSKVEEAELELFRYAPDEAYESKTGTQMEPNYPKGDNDPRGQEWSEDDVYDLYPKLSELYG